MASCDIKSLLKEKYDNKENAQLKQNAIRLAKHHRKTCPGQECDCSLSLLKRLLTKAGIKLTQEESKEFM